jgi:hypothetical protein
MSDQKWYSVVIRSARDPIILLRHTLTLSEVQDREIALGCLKNKTNLKCTTEGNVGTAMLWKIYNAMTDEVNLLYISTLEDPQNLTWRVI